MSHHYTPIITFLFTYTRSDVGALIVDEGEKEEEEDYSVFYTIEVQQSQHLRCNNDQEYFQVSNNFKNSSNIRLHVCICRN